MRVTVLLAIVLTIAFATAGFVERQAHGTATGTTNLTTTITSPTEGVGTGLYQALLTLVRSTSTLSILLLRLSAPPQPRCLRLSYSD